MNTHRYKTEDEALDAASAMLESLIKKASISYFKNGIKHLLLLSSGSSIELLDRITDTYFGEFLTISVLDEKLTGAAKESNFKRISNLDFYDSARAVGCTFIETDLDEEDVEGSRARFESELRQWRSENPTGIITATFDVDTEGKTAGVLPTRSEEEFKTTYLDKEKWVVSNDSDNPSYTVSLSFMKQIDESVTLILGDSSRKAFYRLLDAEGSFYETPARIVRTIEESEVFTDLRE